MEIYIDGMLLSTGVILAEADFSPRCAKRRRLDGDCEVIQSDISELRLRVRLCADAAIQALLGAGMAGSTVTYRAAVGGYAREGIGKVSIGRIYSSLAGTEMEIRIVRGE